ncbi:hypothetical protein J7M07_07205 [bacterium]|nr:hypothetical protein [bacterium]
MKFFFIIAVASTFLLIKPCNLLAFNRMYSSSVNIEEHLGFTGVDSTEVSERKSSWTMEELKEVLTSETGYGRKKGVGWKEKKNARVAMLCALVFPGLGQMYNERPVKAALSMGLETWYLTHILINYRLERREMKVRDSYDKWVENETGENYIDSNWRYHNAWYNEYKARKIDWLWWSSSIVVVLVFDAYVDAHLHGMDFKIESVNVNGGPGVSVSLDF